MVLFLATITLRLFSRVLGADDAPLGAVMGKGGDAGAAVGTATTGVGSPSGATPIAATPATTSFTPVRHSPDGIFARQNFLLRGAIQGAKCSHVLHRVVLGVV